MIIDSTARGSYHSNMNAPRNKQELNVDAEAVAKAHAGSTWGNTTETAEDWQRILQNGTPEERQRVFNKIFTETSDTTLVRKLFDSESIASFLSKLDRPMFKPHIERRRKVWRFLYCDITEAIPELDWVERKRTCK